MNAKETQTHYTQFSKKSDNAKEKINIAKTRAYLLFEINRFNYGLGEENPQQLNGQSSFWNPGLGNPLSRFIFSYTPNPAPLKVFKIFLFLYS